MTNKKKLAERVKRIHVGFRVHPDTDAAINRLSVLLDLDRGRVIDRAVALLSAREGDE